MTPVAFLIATTGTGIAIRGATNLNSTCGEPSPGSIEFGDGTVIAVAANGRMIVTNRGKGTDVAISVEDHGDRAVVTGKIGAVRVVLGGNVQVVGL